MTSRNFVFSLLKSLTQRSGYQPQRFIQRLPMKFRLGKENESCSVSERLSPFMASTISSLRRSSASSDRIHLFCAFGSATFFCGPSPR